MMGRWVIWFHRGDLGCSSFCKQLGMQSAVMGSCIDLLIVIKKDIHCIHMCLVLPYFLISLVKAFMSKLPSSRYNK